MSSSMYKFVKGSRLFMQGTREGADYDNVHDTFRPTVSAAAATVDRSRGGSNGHGPSHVMGEDDDLGRTMPLSLSSFCPSLNVAGCLVTLWTWDWISPSRHFAHKGNS